MSWKGYLTVLGSPSVMLSSPMQSSTMHYTVVWLCLKFLLSLHDRSVFLFVCFFKHRNGLLHLHRHICDHIPRNHWPDTSVGLQEAKSAKEDRTSKSLRSSEARMQSALLLMELLEIIFNFLGLDTKNVPRVASYWTIFHHRLLICTNRLFHQHFKTTQEIVLQSTNEETGNMKLQSVQ